MPAAALWALEVPLCQLGSDVPTVEVPGAAASAFPLPPLPEGGVLAGKSRLETGASTARCLVWQLDGSAPNELLLQEVAISEERRGGAARLRFAAPLLPCVSCTDSVRGGGTLVAAVGADGTLHTLRHTAAASAGDPSATLARALQAPGAVASVPLAPLFQRAGAPTALLEVGGFLCVGTAEGNVVCQPADSADPADAFTLTPLGSLGKVFGGLFGRPASNAVRHLQELRCLDRRLLAVLHDDAYLRLWDLTARRLTDVGPLLPDRAASQRWEPSLARLTAEPLDASTSILLVCFEPRAGGGTDAGTGDGTATEPGMLAMYELFVEHRGEGSYKAMLEGGPRLTGGGDAAIRRVRDLALEPLALHTTGAWLLYDDDAGRRRLACAALSFQPGPPGSETQVVLLEDQLMEGCTAGEALEVQREAWRAVESQLGSGSGSAAAAAGGGGAGLPPAALAAAFVDGVAAPGRLSRAALATALRALGAEVARDDVLGADLAELREQLPRWVAAATPGGGGGGGGSPCAAALVRWSAFLEAYAAAWQEEHRPLALLQLPPQGETHTLLLARSGGLFTALRGAATPEVVLQTSAAPPDWQVGDAAAAEAAAPALAAAAELQAAAGGGQLSRLLWACLRHGLDPEAAVLPAVVAAVAGGSGGGPAPPPAAASGRRSMFGGGGGEEGAEARRRWRAACRALPLRLARLCGDADGGAAGAVAAALRMLGCDWQDAARVRSPLAAMPPTLRAAALATLAQAAWAQLAVLLQLAVLQRYMLWSRSLGLYSLPPEDAAQLEGELLPRTLSLLRAAAVAYWAAVTPAGGGSGGGIDALDPSQLVLSLRIRDGPSPSSAAPKRARLARGGGGGAVAASLLLDELLAGGELHVVRDLPDLQHVSLLSAQRLLCLQPSPLHAAPAGRGGAAASVVPGAPRPPMAPAELAAAAAGALFAGRHTRQLAELQQLLPGDGGDARLLFFKGCSCARLIALAASPAEAQELEDESCSLFFRAAAAFSQPAAFPGQAAALARCAAQLLADAAMGGSQLGDGPEAAELAYYEALATLFERMGRYGAAARCALAAARQAAAALPAPAQLPARAAAQARLWANVFACSLDAGRPEEAYVALLSVEVAEVQLDCLHRLVARLAASPAGVQLLCRLPFAQNIAVLRGGRQGWVPMLAEAVGCLERRAAQLDLGAQPQPYKVLADFHICRSSYQAAAGALLAYARRLVAEGPEDPGQLGEAEAALTAAVSCLSLVDKQHAWVLDPAALPPPGDAAGGDGGDGGDAPVLTLGALRREHAVVQAQAALAAALPGGRGSALLSPGGGGGGGALLKGGDAEDIFSQLLALDQHDAAFQLAEAAFVGTQLQRGLERAFAALAADCVRQQWGGGGGGGAAAGDDAFAAASTGRAPAAGGDGMEIEEVAAAAAAGGGGSIPDARLAAGLGAAVEAAGWRRLRGWLQRHERAGPSSRLRLVILDALLRAEPALMLPPWLTAPFRPPAVTSPLATEAGAAERASPAAAPDLGGALRVLMQHARLAEAAELAAAHLRHLAQSVPSVGMARTAQLCLPHSLLDALAAALAREQGLAEEQRALAELLQRVRGAALGQTDAIQGLFAT